MSSGNFVNGNDVATFVLETDAPYNILDFDQGLCNMTGYTPRELANKICTLDNLLYVEDFADTIASINYQLSVSNLISVQHRIVTKKGDTLTVLCNGQAYSLNDGRDVLQCVFTDITNLETAASESKKAKTDLEIFANTVPSGVSKHILDSKLSLLWANNYFYNLCGYSKAEYKEQFHDNSLSIVHAEDLPVVMEALEDLTEDSQSIILNYRIVCKEGKTKWVNSVFARSGEHQGDYPVINLVMSDITNLKIAETKAMMEEQKYLIISDISEELPFEYDLTDDLITFADKFSNIFDSCSIVHNPAENIPNNNLVSEDTTAAFQEMIALAKAGTEYYSTEFKLNTVNGGFQWYYAIFSTIYDEYENPLRVVGLLRNIHAQKTEQQKLLEKSESDLMTGLLNKTTTEQRIMKSLRHLNGNAYNVLMLIDIDDFKAINDTYGHLKGDQVIIDIANCLKEIASDFDYAGRLGGDEFCIFFTNLLDYKVACEKAEHLAEKLRKMYPGIDDCKVTLSIGIASTKEQIPYNVLLENADTALYKAKLNGKNCYFCYDSNMERGNYVNNRENTISATHDDYKLFSELFDLRLNNKDTNVAINKALALIGKQYRIDIIDIWEYDYDRNFVNCTHEWCRDGIDGKSELKQHTPVSALEELDEMGTDGFVYFSDTSLVKLNASNMNPKSLGVTKFIQSTIFNNGSRVGFIDINILNSDTVWSTREISLLKLITKTLGEVICLKQTENNMLLMREDTINAFSHIDNPIVIADRNSYDVMYFNNSASRYFPQLSLNSKCYAAMYNNSSPCKDCPLHKVHGIQTVQCSKHNPTLDDFMDISIGPIKWFNNSSSFIISASPHKQTKAEQLKQSMEQNISIEKRIAEASYKDLTTGYGNFEKFKLDAQDILANNADTNYVLFYFNIKNFKYINETYGHTIGDKTLKTVADVLNKYVQDQETFSRVIGDTFIMLIRYKNENSFMQTFQAIRNEVHDACMTVQDKFNVDFITGILIIDETMHSYSINRLIDRAIMTGKSIDLTLGVTYAFYDDAYHKKILNEAQIENSMHRALEDEEFCAYVQPKYDILSNNLIGGELLVRWLSPSKGFLEPASFIPSFEKNGFITNIDFFMLEQACKAIRSYLDKDIYILPFSVNLSRITLSSPDFVTIVKNIVDQYYIPHHYIEFEITESIFSENYSLMLDVLKQLKEMDFIINMDDFGTGYSSLTLLRELPIDVIKLDHDFLARSAANDKNAICILKSIIDMAHALDIRIVSEGIETVEQLEMLKSINCEIGQGFLFAKPMPIDDYGKLVKNYSRSE